MTIFSKQAISVTALIISILLSSCGQQNDLETSNEKFNNLDTIEVTGICEISGNYEPCPITNIPKYMRQLVALDQESKYPKGSGGIPSTLSPFSILRQIESGYIIENYIGFKFIKGSGMPGYVGLATNQSDIHPEVTVYEVFAGNLDQSIRNALNVERPVDVVKYSATCQFEKYYRDEEPVVVIIQQEQPEFSRVPRSDRNNMLDEIGEMNLECSAKGHLYYFGLNSVHLEHSEELYKISDKHSGDVVFDKEKIRQFIEAQD